MAERISLPGTWRLKKQLYRLEGEKCFNIDPETEETCETLIFPPRDVCPECGGETQPAKKASR